MKFLKSSFFKNVLTLSSGTVISQILGFLALPFLGRFFSVDEFGIFYTFTGISQALVLVSTLKYEKAIILPADDEEGRNLTQLSILIAVGFVVLSLGVLLALNIFDISYTPLGWLIFLIPFTALTYAIFSAISLWYQREEAFIAMAILTIGQSIGILSISLVLGFLGIRNGLIYGFLLGPLIPVLIVIGFNTNEVRVVFDKLPNLSKRKELFRRYLDFPKYYLPYILMSTGMIYVIPVIITTYYSDLETGYYGMANRILMVPLIVVSFAVNNVFLVEAKKSYLASNNFQPIYKRTFLNMVALGMGIYIVAYFVGGVAIPFLLGDQWIGIEIYVVYLSVILFCEFVVSVFRSNVFIIAERQKLGATIQFFSFLAITTCLIYFADVGIEKALQFLMYIAIVFAIINTTITYKLAKRKVL